MLIKQKPYNLLLLTGILLVLISFFERSKDSAIDLHLHDTYFVIANTSVFRLMGALALFIWVLYFLTNKILYSKALNWIHVIITILLLVIFPLTVFLDGNILNSKPIRYYEFSNWNSIEMHSSAMKAISIIILILLSGQMIFVVNFIAGLFKKKV